MRDPAEQQLALECLKLAIQDTAPPGEVVERAEAYFAFVTKNDAREMLGLVRSLVSS